MCKKVICFDLDDTLYKEIDFLKSAYREIASLVGMPEIANQMVAWYGEGKNVFESLNQILGKDTPLSYYLAIYRNHLPSIALFNGVENTLNELKDRGVILGLITDGRSISQRNKIEVLGLYHWIENQNIIISEEFGSEKTVKRNFCYFMDRYPECTYYYVGDNPMKDFIVPNMLHWETIMLKDDGRNIHKQKNILEKEKLPRHLINQFAEILDYA